MANHHEIANFIWSIADLLRGPYRPPQYERVMLPMTVLRRFDCVLAPTKDKVLREYEHHPEAGLYVYGQDYNKRAFAIAASDMLIKQVDHNGTGENIRFGDSLIDDQFRGERFDYLLANPPFGVDWKRQQQEIQREHEKLGFGGRFGAGLPRVNDGALLFLQHMISKFEPVAPERHQHGSRLAIAFNGSPLFTGGAGSGRSGCCGSAGRR
jgi:type I restriction-modification system DNA methylase subunit